MTPGNRHGRIQPNYPVIKAALADHNQLLSKLAGELG